MKAIIETPVKDYNGISACVRFVDGKAEDEIDECQLAYFKSAGYKVTITDEPKVNEKASNKASSKAKSATKTIKKGK